MVNLVRTLPNTGHRVKPGELAFGARMV